MAAPFIGFEAEHDRRRSLHEEAQTTLARLRSEHLDAVPVANLSGRGGRGLREARPVVSRVTQITQVEVLQTCLGEAFGQRPLGEPLATRHRVQANVHHASDAQSVRIPDEVVDCPTFVAPPVQPRRRRGCGDRHGAHGPTPGRGARMLVGTRSGRRRGRAGAQWRALASTKPPRKWNECCPARTLRRAHAVPGPAGAAPPPVAGRARRTPRVADRPPSRPPGAAVDSSPGARSASSAIRVPRLRPRRRRAPSGRSPRPPRRSPS